jgi:hypothetical protein
MILFQYPSMGRPAQFLANVYRWLDALTPGGDWVLQVLVEDDDPGMQDPYLRAFLDRPCIRVLPGAYRGKVAAYNSHLAAAAWDIYVPVCDDLEPRRGDLDKVIAADMARLFPDGDGILSYPDGSRTEWQMASHIAMGRAYYNRFGYVSHPAYRGLCGDIELTDIVDGLHRRAVLGEQIWTHHHPTMDPSVKMDATYAMWWSREGADRATYEARKRAGFPKEWPPA